jgi:hypothetical protein
MRLFIYHFSWNCLGIMLFKPHPPMCPRSTQNCICFLISILFLYRRYRTLRPHHFFQVLLYLSYDVAVNFSAPTCPLDNDKEIKKRVLC